MRKITMIIEIIMKLLDITTTNNNINNDNITAAATNNLKNY